MKKADFTNELIDINFNIILFTKGRCSIKISQNKYNSKENTIFIINPLKKYYIYDASDDLEYYQITIDIFKLKKIAFSPLKKDFFPDNIQNTIENDTLFSSLIKYCDSAIENKKTPSKLHHKFQYIFENIIDIIKGDYYTKKEELYMINKILDILIYNPTLSIQKLIKALNKDLEYVEDLLKRNINISLKQLYIQCKLYKSKRKLKLSSNVSEIAYDLGFYDQSHFTKYFKKNFILTPKQYQKNLVILEKVS